MIENLSFKISSHLKNIIGRELITDKIIAIFELVKNSYDAGATEVNIYFENIIDSSKSKIRIVDNGQGMTKEDVVNKWLFVAYSEKKEKRSNSHIENITNNQRIYAGAKGVGRFACDRLGSKLTLLSKSCTDTSTNKLYIQWDKFEENAEQEFVNIKTEYETCDYISTHGTELIIDNLREQWDREQILKLKQALTKLISPFANIEDNQESDKFNIFIHCNEELKTDQKEFDQQKKVNGKLQNYIFEKLNLKTTHLSVTVSPDGKNIISTMNDRGNKLFTITQTNPYKLLTDVSADLYYLNRSAKLEFRKIMGVSPVDFGSIFIYKNNFRIMPYGESGHDIFQIDRRKSQGYNRFLGTRDLTGTIHIKNNYSEFIETSSRDGGFVRTSAYDQLEDFFINNVHIVLEKYVVYIIRWGDTPIEDDVDTYVPQDKITDLVKYMVDYKKKGEILSIDANPELLNIIYNNQDHTTDKLIEEFQSLLPEITDKKTSEFAHKLIHEREQLKKDRENLSKEIDSKNKQLQQTTFELDTLKKQNHFLKHLKTPKYNNAEEALHLIHAKALSINNYINNLVQKYNESDTKIDSSIIECIYNISNIAKEINVLYNFVFSADYDIKDNTQMVSICNYIEQYSSYYIHSLGASLGSPLTLEFICNNDISIEDINVKINLIRFNMVIENLINNSIKAHAKNISIEFSKDDTFIYITFIDNGVGLNSDISNPDAIFEQGYTTTKGTGLGLAHVKHTIETMKGNIKLNHIDGGFSLTVGIRYER